MRNSTLKARRRLRIPAITAGLLAAGLLTDVNAQIQSADALLVNVDATGATLGPVTSVPNTGTLGGVFIPTAGATQAPTVTTVGGTKAMQFDGGDFLMLQDGAGSPITAPGGITGPNPTRSIEVWVLNPSVADEETMVSWGHRADPVGSNMSFNYGTAPQYGAVGHWGNRDIGWNNTGGAPAANKWHHLVYTFDGSTTRLYVDGQNTNGEYLGEGAIDTWTDSLILIGAQSEGADGRTITGGLRLSGSIGRVRIHDGVLTPAQVANNYNFEKAAFIDPSGPQEPPAIQPAKITTGPIHRYSFSNTAGDASNGVLDDSVGTADGVVLGAGATFTGSSLVLPGGSSAVAAYGDLPNNLLSAHSTNNGGTGKFALELWYRVTGSQNWSRVFDFGSSGNDLGTEEVLGPGGGQDGRDYLMYSAVIEADPTRRRLEVRNEDPNDPNADNIWTVDNATSSFGRDVHTLITWDEATGQIIAYEDGRQVSTRTVPIPMSEINDVNVWLGRSNWTGDSNVQGEYDEVRIYDYVLTPQQALGNAMAGPQEIHDHEFAPYVVSNPSNITVGQGQNATFAASTGGSAPLSLQWFRDGVAIAGATNRTFTVTNTTINDNNAQFTLRASNTVNGTPASITTTAGTLSVVPPTDRLTSDPVHRWSFNEPAGDATGATVTDSIAGANGTVLGDGATFTGSRLVLPGGPSTSAAYVDLPNGLLSSNGVANGGSGKFSLEAWVKVTASQTWSRIFDFGSSGPLPTEEVTGPGGGGNGQDYLMYSAQFDNDVNRRRLEVHNQDPAGGVGDGVADHFPSNFNQDMHLVVTWDEATGRLFAYENGRQVATLTTTAKMSDINDINVWLGRSNWTGDRNVAGEFQEVRMYDTVLTERQALGSLQAGYSVINRGEVLPTFVQAPQSATLLEAGNLQLTAEVHGATPMTFQWLRNGQPIQGAITPSLTVSNVTSADNNASFTLRVSNSAGIVTSDPAVLTVTPYVIQEKHRYAFNETEGTVIKDSVGTADGEAIGGVTLGGGLAMVDGNDGYINLPNGIISELGDDATIELWFSLNTAATWTRIFDFGTSGIEDVPDVGVDYLFLTSRTGGEGWPLFVANFPSGPETLLVPQPPGWLPPNEQTYVAITWSSSKNVSRMYFNGVLVRTGTAPQSLSTLAGRDVNNWLGRSQWSTDAYYAGSYNELRLTSGALSQDQIAASFAAGPTTGGGGTGPSITVSKNGNNLTLSFPASAATEGYVLQSAPALQPGGTWTNVSGVTQNGANMEATVPMDQNMQFFRLAKP